MKRLRKLCLVSASFILLLSSATVFPSAASTTYIRGDADNDGVLCVNDVTLIQRVLVGLEKDSNGSIAKRADLDGNGLDINDATMLQQYLAEFDNPKKIGETVSENTQSGDDEYELPFVPITS